jgi:hypothetical protein
MHEPYDYIPPPVLRRLVLGRLGFTYDHHHGDWRRGPSIVTQEQLDTMAEEEFGVPGVTG